MGKSNIDYAFKSWVLKEHSDLIYKQRQSSLLTYAICKSIEDGDATILCNLYNRGVKQDLSELQHECKELGLSREYLECIKINKASYERTKRLRNRVTDMLVSGNCIFLTLTFTDDTLANTSSKQRRVAVTRYLKLFNAKYVANIDFGAKNHREHYHAIIQCDNVDYSKWIYGAINGEKIVNRDISTDSVKLAKYVAKLSNHAIKETTKRSSLIYSR